MTAPEVDVEDVVIAYLTGLDLGVTVSAKMPSVPPLPFVLVQRVAGGDDWIVDYATVSVHSFAEGQTDASTIARTVHHAMRQLHSQTTVTVDGGSVNVYAPVEVEQTPIYLEWEPTGGGTVLSRYVARYIIRLRLPSITGF
jgi:hypothetical protein